MTYLLDSDTCIEHLRATRHGTSSRLVAKLKSLQKGEIVLCSIVRAELLYGAEHSQRRAANLSETRQFLASFPSLLFDDVSAEIYGSMRADLARRGNAIQANDMLIAAIALANDLTLVTHNTKHFSRIPGLQLEDWQ